ncbi:MAG TPA: glycoside hydrolase family 2 TIM barrel-domain containing protein, partial [Verrucomicrobiae bacterium]
LILDQGYYPDGIWTAPSDAALKHDIELSLAAGYNGARLHQKVFEPRYLYWADKMGYLVWGEFPSWGYNYQPENYANYLNEWVEILLRDRNHPAIVGWCPFNESAAEAGEIQRIVFHETKAIDPTRPALETSGWFHSLAQPEVRDDHDYNQVPAHFKKRWLEYFNGSSVPSLPAPYNVSDSRRELGVPFMVSEFGGIGWATEGGWGYGDGPKTEAEFYTRYGGLVAALLDNPDMFGFCYTQLTDVEQEHNGLYYYDRRPKFDVKRLHDLTARPAAYEQTGPHIPLTAVAAAGTADWQVLVGFANDPAHARPFHYTTNPPAATWNTAGFDDAVWTASSAPFGTINHARTSWTTDDIWLRQDFNWEGGSVGGAALVIFHDEDTEIYVNGELVWSRPGFNTRYETFVITDTLKRALRPGKNLVAIHTHQTGGGQCIDLGLLVRH